MVCSKSNISLRGSVATWEYNNYHIDLNLVRFRQPLKWSKGGLQESKLGTKDGYKLLLI